MTNSKNHPHEEKQAVEAARHALLAADPKGMSLQDILALVATLQALIAQFSQHPTTPPVVPPVVPPPVVPPVVVPPVVTPPPAAGKVTISAIRMDNHGGIYWLKEWKNGPRTGEDVGPARFSEIMDQGQQMTRGGEIHFNGSPIDASGQEIGPGDPRHLLVNGGKPYVRFRIKVGDETSDWLTGETTFAGLELHGWDHDYGFTPNLKIPSSLTNSRHRPCQLQMGIITQPEVVGAWTPVVYVP